MELAEEDGVNPTLQQECVQELLYRRNELRRLFVREQNNAQVFPKRNCLGLQ